MRNVVLFFLLLISINSFGYNYESLRDGKIYIRGGSNETITISYQEVWQASTHKDYVYLQSPTGELLETTELGFSDLNGDFTYSLNAGPGDYIITFPSYTYRAFTVTIPNNIKSVYEPPKFYMNCYVSNGFDEFYFYVPATTSSFKILGRKDLNSNADTLTLYDQNNEFVTALYLPEHSYSGAYAPYNSYQENSPHSGFWKISIEHGSYNEKVAFWLDDIPNYFCVDTAYYFIPVTDTGYSSIYASNIAGGAAIIGGALGGNPVQEIMDNVEFMGLESNNYYIDQNYREPVNDNADPNNFNWPAFNWADDYRIGVYTGSPYNLEMVSIFAPAEWLGSPVSSLYDMNEMAEFYEAYLIHHNVENQIGLKYFTAIDEPNLQNNYTMTGYAELVSAIGQRKNSSFYPEVRNTKLLAPSSSNFTDATTTGEFGAEWAEYIYQNYDENIDGINFHIWNQRDLLSAHLYRDEIIAAHNIIANNDTDSDTLETIIIEQTNMNSGDGSSPYYVNTFYSSLWWTGVVCNAINTGYVTSINWFNTVDDYHHKKGLMYDDSNAYQLKPVGYATKFLIENKLDSVIVASSSHPEVDVLVTIDKSKTKCFIIASNKGKRLNICDLNVILPNGFENLFEVEVFKIDSLNNLALSDTAFLYSGTTINFQYRLSDKSIYAFRFIAQPTEINYYASDNDIEIFPNPTKGVVTVTGAQIQKIEIININGEKIRTVVVEEEQQDVDLSNLSKGTYLFNIVTSEAVIAKKVVLE